MPCKYFKKYILYERFKNEKYKAFKQKWNKHVNGELQQFLNTHLSLAYSPHSPYVCLSINELKRKILWLHVSALWNQWGAGFYSFKVTQVELCPTVSSSKCCWCTQTYKFVFPRASYTQSRTVRAPDLPLPQTSEAAIVWAETCNQHYYLGLRQCSLLGT